MNHLEPHQTYAWYTIVEDDYTGRTVSDIWTFTTGDGKSNSKNKKK